MVKYNKISDTTNPSDHPYKSDISGWLDDDHLLMIEQPVSCDDLVDHCRAAEEDQNSHVSF